VTEKEVPKHQTICRLCWNVRYSIQTIKQTTDINEDTCSQQYMYTAEVYDEQVHGHIFNSVEGRCQNNKTIHSY
jgi:hypothetical protein